MPNKVITGRTGYSVHLLCIPAQPSLILLAIFLQPNRFGIKMYILTNSKSGYIQRMVIYKGKQHSAPPSKFGSTFDVVAQLTEHLQGKNYKVYFDNFYTSLRLMKHLHSKGIYACGTSRYAAKTLPAEWNIVSKQTKNKWARGTFTVHQDLNTPNITATMWCDTKIVKFLSTISTPGISVNIARRVLGQPRVIQQPSAAHQYSQHYKGVDFLDFQIAHYTVGRPSKKVSVISFMQSKV